MEPGPFTDPTGSDRRPLQNALPAARLLGVRLLLRLLGFRRTYRLLRRTSRRSPAGATPPSAAPHPPQPPPAAHLPQAAALAEAFAGTRRAFPLPRANCLVESLTLWWELRRSGLAADLRVGVRLIDGRLESHAWVEYDGRVLNDAGRIARLYTPLDLDRHFTPR